MKSYKTIYSAARNNWAVISTRTGNAIWNFPSLAEAHALTDRLNDDRERA